MPFWSEEDTLGIVGQLGFGTEAPQPANSITGWPGTQYAAEIPIDEQSSWAYSWTIDNFGTPNQRRFRISRSMTSDGQSFTDSQVVFSALQPGAQGFANVVRRPTDGRLFGFSWRAGTLDVWRSDSNAANWEYQGEAYSGHDAMNIIWHPGLGKFLNYQTYLKPWPEKDPDDNLANLRRVIEFRTSADGIHWEDISPSFLGGKAFWEPDQLDDPDMEFYRVATFPVQGRYAMMLLDYKADPNTPGEHSRVRLRTEWAISNDGLNWQRPFRNSNAEQYTGWTPVQGPLITENGLFFNDSGNYATMATDRIFYVKSTGDAQYTTLPITIPTSGLFLNAEVSGSSFVRAELLNSNGQVIPGFDSSGLLIENQNGGNLPLLWNGNNASQLAGQTAQLRFYLRDAKIYDVHYASGSDSSVALPIGYWRFEETQGNVISDSGILQQYNGTLRGGAARSTTSLPFSTIPRTGEPNTRSLEFNGVNGTAVTWNSAGILDVGSSDFTLEAWIAPRSADKLGLIAGKLISGLFNDHGYDLHVRPTGDQPSASTYQVKFEVRDPDGGGNDGGAGFAILSQGLSFDEWHHVAGVRDGTDLRLYLDGLLVGTAQLSGAANFNSLQSFAVGGGVQGAGGLERAFNGYIDEVRLTMEALSVNQFLFAFQPPANFGDYNGNGVVDAADYVVWRKTLGSTINLAADGNGDGTVNQGDYGVWRNNFGNSSGSSAATSVPEPSAIILLTGVLALLLFGRGCLAARLAHKTGARDAPRWTPGQGPQSRAGGSCPS